MAAAKESGTVGSSSNNTVIGPSILISGKLSGDEDLTVRGRVEGELSLTKTLIIEASGIVKANVSVKNAIVSGVVVGNVSATDSVELTKDGRMVGDIKAPRVIIVDGASFRGRVDMGELEPGRSVGTRPVVRPTVRGAQPGRPAGKPPPPPPKPEVKAKGGAPAPPAPPKPPRVAESAKKTVVVRKKAR